MGLQPPARRALRDPCLPVWPARLPGNAMERGACARRGKGPGQWGGHVPGLRNARGLPPPEPPSSGRAAGTPLPVESALVRAGGTWRPSWTESDGQPHPLPDPEESWP